MTTREHYEQLQQRFDLWVHEADKDVFFVRLNSPETHIFETDSFYEACLFIENIKGFFWCIAERRAKKNVDNQPVAVIAL